MLHTTHRKILETKYKINIDSFGPIQRELQISVNRGDWYECVGSLNFRTVEGLNHWLNHKFSQFDNKLVRIILGQNINV